MVWAHFLQLTITTVNFRTFSSPYGGCLFCFISWYSLMPKIGAHGWWARGWGPRARWGREACGGENGTLSSLPSSSALPSQLLFLLRRRQPDHHVNLGWEESGASSRGWAPVSPAHPPPPRLGKVRPALS